MKRILVKSVIGCSVLAFASGCMMPTPQQSHAEDNRLGAQNFTYDGSFLGGRRFKTHEFIPNVSKSEAMEKALKCIASSGRWTINSVDKELGIISASQTVSYGQGKTAPMNVGITDVENGVDVSIASSISGGETAPVSAIKNYYCKLMAAIADAGVNVRAAGMKSTLSPKEGATTLGNGSPESKLKKLKELKDSGVLTEEEYQTKRKALVDKL